ncbi:MAG: hypothetical protein QOK13_1988 [Gaiellaceae bacterium]|nr:hypothetical protein [Gaiellaceae bacterium]
MKRAVTASIALVACLVLWAQGGVAAPVSAPQTAASPPGTLTAQGRLLWNFEALLLQRFVGRKVSVSPPENFSCAGDCAPLSKYRPYRFTFLRPSGTAFHVSRRTFGDNGEFGNYPIAVLIRGRAVACDARETRFLIAYRSMASFTLACLAGPPG